FEESPDTDATRSARSDTPLPPKIEPRIPEPVSLDKPFPNNPPKLSNILSSVSLTAAVIRLAPSVVDAVVSSSDNNPGITALIPVRFLRLLPPKNDDSLPMTSGVKYPCINSMRFKEVAAIISSFLGWQNLL